MEQLKYKVFEVLSRTLSVEAFEQWLYADPYVAEHITDDDLVLELMNLNYQSERVLQNLESLCKEYFGEEDFLVAVVEFNCKKFLAAVSVEAVYEMVGNIRQYYWSTEDYILINSFYNASIDLELAELGHFSMDEIVEELVHYSMYLIDTLKDADIETRKHLLYEGIMYQRLNSSNYAPLKKPPLPSFKPKPSSQPEHIPNKWWQFWK